jgi:hypothetical protein
VPAAQAQEAIVDALRKGEGHAEEMADVLAVFHSPYKIFEHHLVVGHHQLWAEEFQGKQQRGNAILAARKRDDDTGRFLWNLLQQRWLVKQGRQF